MDADDRRKILEDEVRVLSAEIDARGYWVKGSQGQEILNPALAARRACLEALRKLDLVAAPVTESALDVFMNAGS